jgi:hypothetical protein
LNQAAVLYVLSHRPANFSLLEHFFLRLSHPMLYTRANPDRRCYITEAATDKDIKCMLLCRWRAGRWMKDAKKRKKQKIGWGALRRPPKGAHCPKSPLIRITV